MFSGQQGQVYPASYIFWFKAGAVVSRDFLVMRAQTLWDTLYLLLLQGGAITLMVHKGIFSIVCLTLRPSLWKKKILGFHAKQEMKGNITQRVCNNDLRDHCIYDRESSRAIFSCRFFCSHFLPSWRMWVEKAQCGQRGWVQSLEQLHMMERHCG